jgi:hypothetical protein
MNEKRNQRAQERHTRDDKLAQQEAMRRLLSQPDGRRLIWGILDDAGLYRNPHTGNALDSAFRAGMMSVGQEVLARVEEADSRAFITMLEENMQIQEALAAKLAEGNDDEYATDDG